MWHFCKKIGLTWITSNFKFRNKPKGETYSTWLNSMSGNSLTGERTMFLTPFLSHNQRYPFIAPLHTANSNEKWWARTRVIGVQKWYPPSIRINWASMSCMGRYLITMLIIQIDLWSQRMKRVYIKQIKHHAIPKQLLLLQLQIYHHKKKLLLIIIRSGRKSKYNSSHAVIV